MNLFAFLKTSPSLAYFIVFLGAIIEGETIILGASALASTGYLSIVKIFIIALLTTIFIDQVLFFLGRWWYRKPGRPLSERFPKIYRKSKRVVILLKRYDIWFILSFRFIYGIRSVSPVVIGLCGIKPRRFVTLNIISALLWAILSCSIGYWLGDTLLDIKNDRIVFKNVQKIEQILCSLIVLVLVVVGFKIYFSANKKRKKLRLALNKEEADNLEKKFFESTHASSAAASKNDSTKSNKKTSK